MFATHVRTLTPLFVNKSSGERVSIRENSRAVREAGDYILCLPPSKYRYDSA